MGVLGEYVRLGGLGNQRRKLLKYRNIFLLERRGTLIFILHYTDLLGVTPPTFGRLHGEY